MERKTKKFKSPYEHLYDNTCRAPVTHFSPSSGAVGAGVQANGSAPPAGFSVPLFFSFNRMRFGSGESGVGFEVCSSEPVTESSTHTYVSLHFLLVLRIRIFSCWLFD